MIGNVILNVGLMVIGTALLWAQFGVSAAIGFLCLAVYSRPDL